MADEDKVIQIPTWFLKLSGWVLSAVLGFVVIWSSWVTVTMIEIKSAVVANSSLRARITEVEKDLLQLKLQMSKMENEKIKTK